jgi:hypothetical protein
MSSPHDPPPLPRDLSSLYAPTAVLSIAPLIVLCSTSTSLRLGAASVLGPRFRHVPSTFLVMSNWTIENADRIARLRAGAEEFRRQAPDHTLIFLGQTEKETALLRAAGETALTLNHNAFVSDTVFHPTPGPVEFDAVYNAAAVDWKRHELAARIPRVLYITYSHAGRPTPEQTAILDGLLALAPQHVLLNEIVEGMPRFLSSEQVNLGCGRAAVGLCLSPAEGAMYASMEYMLAGLPVVSTPSKGGRDVFFDPAFCMIVDPDADAVAAAVAELRGRAIPRELVRNLTLEKIEGTRQRFLSLLNEQLAAHGYPPRFGPAWPFPQAPRIVNWLNIAGLVRDVDKALAGAGAPAAGPAGPKPAAASAAAATRPEPASQSRPAAAFLDPVPPMRPWAEIAADPDFRAALLRLNRTWVHDDPTTFRTAANPLYAAGADYRVDGGADPARAYLCAAFLHAVTGRRSLLQIGLRGGHAVLVALAALPEARLVATDLLQAPGAADAAAVLADIFGPRLTIYRGDSRDVLPFLATHQRQTRFDLVLADGTPGSSVLRSDISNALRLAAPGAALYLDDAAGPAAEVYREFVSLGWLRTETLGGVIAGPQQVFATLAGPAG